MKTEMSVTLSRLNCNGCVRNVTKALQTLPEVELVHTDIPTKTVHLRYPEQRITLPQIKTVLLEAGYPVEASHPVPQDQQGRVEAEVQ
jgi:Cu+-exporting ATPase